MAAIDIGAAAINRGSLHNKHYTIIAVDNSADGTGTIDAIEVWMYTLASDSKAGTFYGSGTSYTNRDYETLGAITAGSKQTFSGLDIDVSDGDYIGGWFTGVGVAHGRIDRDTSGYAGIYIKSGDWFGQGQQTYALTAGDAISLYGTGETEQVAAARSQVVII